MSWTAGYPADGEQWLPALRTGLSRVSGTFFGGEGNRLPRFRHLGGISPAFLGCTGLYSYMSLFTDVERAYGIYGACFC